MNIDMIEAAAQRIGNRARVTPLLSSPFIDKLAGRRVWVKAECLQHTGSFKIRGGWSAVSALSDEVRARGVFAFSSGNHAQGVALAAQAHGIPSVILMPSDAPRLKIDNTRALGAEVVLYDRAKDDRDGIGKRLAEDRGLTLIRPFDDAQVIAGQGTVGLEIARQAQAEAIGTATVLVCCGGGGLTSGIALALEAHAPGLRVRPCEPEGFDDVTRSLASGIIERNASLSGSLCDAIITPQPGYLTFPILQRLCGAGIVITDEEALRAMAVAYARLKIVLEPGGAAALAAALFHGDELEGEDVIAVATGGNVDTDIFARALNSYGTGD
jgi:threonine dehydratase